MEPGEVLGKEGDPKMTAVAANDASIARERFPRSIPCLPLGRRTPRGRVRWYLVQVPEGHERTTCERVRRIVPADILADAFVPAKERWMKRAGRHFKEEVLMYKGFFLAATGDVVALDRELSALSFSARLVGSGERAWTPVDDGAVAWLIAAMDSRHVIRSSTAVIVDGRLHVTDGPLVGQESRVTKIDRHDRVCQVKVLDDGFTERMPLDVPFKS